MGLNKKIEDNASIIVITSIVMLVVVILISVVVFFAYLKTEDQVLVPSVEGRTLEDALVELQVKELYPRLQLRFSDDPSERGRVLSQSPTAGTVAKAGRRVTLVVRYCNRKSGQLCWQKYKRCKKLVCFNFHI